MEKYEQNYSAQQQLNNLLATKGPTFIHSEDSPYFGLSLAEQKILAKMRRGPGKTPKWRTEMMRKATKQDYQKLLLACVETLVAEWYNPDCRLDRIVIYVRLPFNYRQYWDKELPRPVILGYEDWNIIVAWKIDSIVNWLYEKGHSSFKCSELRKSVWGILKEQERLDLYYEVASDTSILELYSEIVGATSKQKRDRSMKGRRSYVENREKV